MQNFADRLVCKTLHAQGGEKNVDTMPISAPRQAGIYVRRAREAQGLTRAQLAAAAGVSERLLASLELGDATGIRLDKLLAVFDALGLSLAARGEKIASPAAVPVSKPVSLRREAAPLGAGTALTTFAQLFREIAREQGIALPEEAS